jgi:hypothetical protein
MRRGALLVRSFELGLDQYVFRVSFFICFISWFLWYVNSDGMFDDDGYTQFDIILFTLTFLKEMCGWFMHPKP